MLYLTTTGAAAPRAEIYLKDLMVTYRPPEKAFVAEWRGLSPFAPRKPRSFAERKATLISRRSFAQDFPRR